MIELLVVIAIIAALAALLFPVLTAARAKAQSTICLGNLKQLQVCAVMYSADNNDILPPNNAIDDFTEGDPLDTGISWCAGSARTDVTYTNIQHGLLYQYNGSVAIYHCPADQAMAVDDNGNTLGKLHTRSYSLSQSINGYPEYDAEVDDPAPSFKKSSQIRSPAPTQLITFLDVHEDEITDSIFGIPTQGSDDYPSNWDDLPANRHLQGCNFSFADGHVEHWHWQHPKMVIDPDAGQLVANGEAGDYQKVESGILQ